MGREIRLVPPNWNHPKNEKGNYQPMHDFDLDQSMKEWLETFDRIRSGNLTDIEKECYGEKNTLANWILDENPPDPKYYVPYKEEECSWFQVYETVSEGTPVTPAFSTKEELIDYLVNHGDYWQQKNFQERWHLQPNKPGFSREAAESFVKSEYSPSFVMVVDEKKSSLYQGIESCSLRESPLDKI